MNLSALVPQNVTRTDADAPAKMSRDGLRVRSGVRAGVLYIPYRSGRVYQG